MKSMRQMINLMEGVMAVPGIGGNLEEKSTSEKQARFMAAAAHDPAFANKVGMDTSVAKEFNAADTGTKQLSNAMKHKEEESCEMEESVPAVASCQQTNPADAVIACAMEEGIGMHDDSIADALAQYDEMMSSFVDPAEAITVIMSWHDEAGDDTEKLDAIHSALMAHAGHDDGEPDDSMDGDFDSAMASAGHGSDEDYGYNGDPEEFEEAFDLQNGYDDINDASGNDYFPNGADSPVVRATGPSGARQGDNPEQKKMQVAEVHKELVYGYRNFLKESSQKKKLTESQLVSNLSIKDIGGDFYTTDDGVFLDGGVTASGTAINLQGATVKVTFDIDIKAAAPISWEDDEYPTGWNHKTDSITYSSDYRPEVGVIEVSSVEFSDGMAFYINNEDLYLRDAQNILGPDVMKQLLDPVVYQRLLGPAFDKKVENIDPPEQDHNEPERSDSDFM